MSNAGAGEEVGGASRRIDGLGWALAFIWIGIALLAGLGWGWLLTGLGVITLGAQGFLAVGRQKTSGFWLVCGVVLLGSGAWELLQVRWSFAPFLFIAVGLVMLLGAIRRRTP